MLAPDQLTFGVEIECILPPDVHAYDPLCMHLQAAGVRTQVTTYAGRAAAGRWKVAGDGSLTGQVGGPRTGYVGLPVEVVSPVLQGAAGLAETRRALDAIASFGCRVNRSCGLHVHVGARDLFGRQLGAFKELAKTYTKYEAVIDGLLAPSRRGSSNVYCQPAVVGPQDADTVENFARRYNHGSRYCKLNVQAYWRHGTVEFRHHQGTVEADKVEAWVRLCLRVVSHATRNEEPERGARRYRTEVDVEVISSDALRGYSPRRDRTGSIAVRPRRATNPRREGTRGHENWEQLTRLGGFETNTMGVSLRRAAEFSWFGMDHIRWDADHGNIEVVRRNERRILIPEGGEAPAEPFTATDDAPPTLEGLLDLVEAEPEVRAYFKARQRHFAGADNTEE